MKWHLAAAVFLGGGVAALGLPAEAQNCNSAPPSWGNAGAYESWCRACGGTVSGSGPRIQCNPGPNWGGRGGGASGADSNMYNGLHGASYNLGYALGRWLFGSGSDPQAERQKQQMMAELRRRQAEAERQHREEEARRLAAMYNRLAATLKLGGLPDLKMKETSGDSSGLKLKIGDGAGGQAGIKGLPGVYLNDGKVPFGIPGLPGVYTGGPGQGSGLGNAMSAAGSGLQLKIGDDRKVVPDSQTALPDPGSMTPQQLADVAELVSKLPPEEQQALLDATQRDAAAVQPASLQRQAAASQAAASATAPEDASEKARTGFDQPLGPSPARLDGTNPEPALLRSATPAPPALPPATPAASAGKPAEDFVSMFLFPGSRPAGPFPENPEAPLANPLREEQRMQAELKAWDDWAVERAIRVFDKPKDEFFVAEMAMADINTAAVKQYAPELLARYESDRIFRQSVDLKLRYAAGNVALVYYQEMADAHKAAIRAFREEVEKLADAGMLDRLVPLEDQFRLHPERRPIVQAVRERISAGKEAALEKVRAGGSDQLDKEYRFVFQRLRTEAAQPSQ